MREAESLKLLIPFIESICDSEHYLELLRWLDKSRKIFFLSWIHKSSANWNPTKTNVFKKWAEYKRKLGEKDDRDFKAAFRNALRSKKHHLRLIEKGKEYRHWQILSEPIRPPNNKTANKKRKPRQKRLTKKIGKRCQPESEISFQEPPPSSDCNSVYNDDEFCHSSPLPPCETLFHVSPPSTPLQKTDLIFTELGTLEIPAAAESVRDHIYGIPSPNVYSSPQSPAQMSVCESLYRIPSPNVYSSPQSPAQMSVSESLYGIPSPNLYSSPHSPAQTSNLFPDDKTRHSACNSPISVSNALPVWMSPEQEVPAWDMGDSFNAVSEMEQSQLKNQAQGPAKQNGFQWYSTNFYQTRNEELVEPSSPQDFFETMVEIDWTEHSSLSPEPGAISQEGLVKVLSLDLLDSLFNCEPQTQNNEERQFLELLDNFDTPKNFTCHQL